VRKSYLLQRSSQHRFGYFLDDLLTGLAAVAGSFASGIITLGVHMAPMLLRWRLFFQIVPLLASDYDSEILGIPYSYLRRLSSPSTPRPNRIALSLKQMRA
jgi:hypothetical protein